MCAKTLYPDGAPRSSPAEIRVSLHEFLGPMIGETDSKLTVFAIALDSDDGPCAIGGVAHSLADERIGSAGRAPQARLRGGTRSAGRGGGRAGGCSPAPHPAGQFFPGGRVSE